MDKAKFVAYLDKVYLDAQQDLKNDHDLWDEGQMQLAGHLLRIINAGAFDE